LQDQFSLGGWQPDGLVADCQVMLVAAVVDVVDGGLVELSSVVRLDP
jgi:hypothetical protein